MNKLGPWNKSRILDGSGSASGAETCSSFSRPSLRSIDRRLRFSKTISSRSLILFECQRSINPWSKLMLTAYLEAAMRNAHYELLPEDGQYYGEIPQCNGVYATAAPLEEC